MLDGRSDARACPVCGANYASGVRFCPRDGATIADHAKDYAGFLSYRRDGGPPTTPVVKPVLQQPPPQRPFFGADEQRTGRLYARGLPRDANDSRLIILLSPPTFER